MEYTQDDFNDYRLGFTKGSVDAKNGIAESQSCEGEYNDLVLLGIHDAYVEYLKQVYDSKKELLLLSRNFSQLREVVDSYYAYKNRILDEYSLSKISENEYTFNKDGVPAYSLTRNKSGKWECSCPAFHYHGTCKHLDYLKFKEGKTTERLPQHLARVRQLQNSLKLWEDRLQSDPDNKLFKSNVEARRLALDEATKKAEEIEALPKPTRHPREEFEGVVPLLDKLFNGIADYEIVGSWRRGKDSYKDCDILTPMDPNQWKELKARLEDDPNFVPAPGHTHIDWGDEVIRGGYKNGDRVDYLDINRVPNKNEWGAWMLFRTGSAQFNIAMRGWLKKFGCGLSERGLLDPQGNVVASKSEEDIFNAIGIPFIEPKDREDARVFYKEVRELDEPAFLKTYKENYEPSIPMSDSAIPTDKRSLVESICKDYLYCNASFARPYSSGKFHIAVKSAEEPVDLFNRIQGVFPKTKLKFEKLGVVGKNGKDEDVFGYSIYN